MDEQSIIRIDGLTFRGFHGVYPEEQKNGNDFEVDLVLGAETLQASVSDSISDTIDYSKVCSVVREVMERRCNLLETLSHRIADHLLESFPDLQYAEVTVAKLRPSIGMDCKRTSVRILKRRK